MANSQPQPRPFAHVGVTVPDVEEAIDWYETILGFECIMGPEAVAGDGDSHISKLCLDVLGEFEEVKIAHLATGGQAALELFEFEEGTASSPDPKAEGYFHVCVIDPNIEALAATIDDSGGDHHTDIWELFPGQPYRMTYCKDPWGNLLEIYTHSHERIYSNQDDY